MRQVVHVNQALIAKDRKQGSRSDAIIVRDYRGASRASVVTLKHTKTGEELGRFIYRPEKPLPCGARLWLELNTDVCEAVTVAPFLPLADSTYNTALHTLESLNGLTGLLVVRDYLKEYDDVVHALDEVIAENDNGR